MQCEEVGHCQWKRLRENSLISPESEVSTYWKWSCLYVGTQSLVCEPAALVSLRSLLDTQELRSCLRTTESYFHVDIKLRWFCALQLEKAFFACIKLNIHSHSPWALADDIICFRNTLPRFLSSCWITSTLPFWVSIYKSPLCTSFFPSLWQGGYYSSPTSIYQCTRKHTHTHTHTHAHTFTFSPPPYSSLQLKPRNEIDTLIVCSSSTLNLVLLQHLSEQYMFM